MNRGGNISVTGDFTMLKYIATFGAEELERRVGYERGRLKSGFLIVALSGDESITPEDFELKASTGWSGGAIKRSGADDLCQGIESILVGRNQDVAELKRKVAGFFGRRGGNTPAKVLPSLRHTDSMKYPDAELLGPGIRSGIPQFTLLIPRRFIIIRDEK